jgi:hypothetical protein
LGGSSPPGLRGSRAPGGGLCSPSPAQHNRFEKIAAKRFAAKLPRHFSRIRGDVGAARCRRWSTPLGTAQSTRSPCAPSGRGGRAPGRWSWLSCRLAGCRHFPPSEPCLVGVCAASLCSGQRLLTRDLLPTRADPTVYGARCSRGRVEPGHRRRQEDGRRLGWRGGLGPDVRRRRKFLRPPRTRRFSRWCVCARRTPSADTAGLISVLPQLQ